MNRTALLMVLTLATTVEAQSNSVGAGASMPVGGFSPVANAGFGLALLSQTEQRIGPFDVRVDITFDRFGGKGTVTRFQYTSFGLSLVNEMGAGVYWLGGLSLYQAADQQTNPTGSKGTANHSNGGVKAGLGVNFSLFGRGAFLEGNWIKLFAAGPGITWVPVRLGIRI